MYPLNLFFNFPPWTLSRVCAVVSLAVGTDSIFCACPTIMVWKTTAGTDKFATTCVLSMPKPLTYSNRLLYYRCARQVLAMVAFIKQESERQRKGFGMKGSSGIVR